MLTLNLIREKRDFIAERLKVKNFRAEETLDKIRALTIMKRTLSINIINFLPKRQ